MQKISFIDMCSKRVIPFLWMVVAIFSCRLFGQFLAAHSSTYGIYPAFNFLVWFFRPGSSMSPWIGIALMIAAQLMLVGVEYRYKKIILEHDADQL